MKKLILKIITLALGILILCVVFKYAFKFDLWNIFIVPLFKSIVDTIKSLFK